jgi:hypothetical protein
MKKEFKKTIMYSFQEIKEGDTTLYFEKNEIVFKATDILFLEQEGKNKLRIFLKGQKNFMISFYNKNELISFLETLKWHYERYILDYKGVVKSIKEFLKT